MTFTTSDISPYHSKTRLTSLKCQTAVVILGAYFYDHFYADSQGLVQIFFKYAYQIVVETFLNIFAVLSLLGNGLLIVLVLHKESRNLGGYRYLLISFAFGDIIVSTFNAMALPVHFCVPTNFFPSLRSPENVNSVFSDMVPDRVRFGRIHVGGRSFRLRILHEFRFCDARLRAFCPAYLSLCLSISCHCKVSLFSIYCGTTDTFRPNLIQNNWKLIVFLAILTNAAFTCVSFVESVLVRFALFEALLQNLSITFYG